MSEASQLLRMLVLPQAQRRDFAEWRRKRMALPRIVVFVVVGLGFAAASLQNQFLFRATGSELALLQFLELGVAAPVLFLAALVTGLRLNLNFTRAVQTVAMLTALGCTLFFRYLAHSRGISYPAEMSGIILIAFATFGGFNWERIALGSALYLSATVTLEFTLAPDGANPMIEAYAGLFMALIACAGAIVQELLMRFAWTELVRSRQARADLQRSEERFQAYMDHNPALAWMKDESGRYQYANRAFRRFIGVEDDSWIGKSDQDYFPEPFARKSRELDKAALVAGSPLEKSGSAVGASGQSRQWSLVRFPFTDGAGRRFIGGVATDITEQKRAENLIRLQALTDELTGLYNRRGFSLVAQESMDAARQTGTRCALTYVDLDNLKLINESHGHSGGDAAIVAVSEALRIAANRNDIIARVGGDEFLVFTTESKTISGLNTRIAEAIAHYSHSQATPFKVSATIGIWEFDPVENLSLEDQIQQADQLMLANKIWKTRSGPRNQA